MQLKASYWSGDNMTSPLFKNVHNVQNIILGSLICSGNFCNLQNILFDCFIAVCVACCIKTIFENCISVGTSVPVVYSCRAIFTVCLGIFI